MAPINWKENLEQILMLHEIGIESEINKTVAAFESFVPAWNGTFVSCFFDILKNR